MVWVGGCDSDSERAADENPEEMLTLEERIEAASTFEEILACNQEIETDSEEEKMLFEKAKDYLFSSTILNGTYYKSEIKSESDIAINVLSRDEIYVIPVEDADEFEDSISDLPNADDYKYKLTWIEIGDDSVYVELSRVADDYEVGLAYIESPKCVTVYQLPQWEDYYGGDFYAAKSIAEEKLDENLDEEINKLREEQALKESDPKVGMTESEVLKSKWGYPDDKNIDEYEWGTSEQWVYEGKGYVYFENGIVTSVSHR